MTTVHEHTNLLASVLEDAFHAYIEPHKADLTVAQQRRIRIQALHKMIDAGRRIEEIWIPTRFEVGGSTTVQFRGMLNNVSYIDEQTIGLGGTLWRIMGKRAEKIDKRNEGKGIEFGTWYLIEDTGEGLYRRSQPNKIKELAKEPTPTELLESGQPFIVPEPIHVGQMVRLKDGTEIYWADKEHVLVNGTDWHIKDYFKNHEGTVFNCDYKV